MNISMDISKKPNYVTTNEKDTKHYIPPIKIPAMKSEKIKDILLDFLRELGGTILIDKNDYVKAAFYSNFFKFEDIAQFEISVENGLIYLRSEAQKGWYDFNVNRKRMEKLREKIGAL